MLSNAIWQQSIRILTFLRFRVELNVVSETLGSRSVVESQSSCGIAKWFHIFWKFITSDQLCNYIFSFIISFFIQSLFCKYTHANFVYKIHWFTKEFFGVAYPLPICLNITVELRYMTNDEWVRTKMK